MGFATKWLAENALFPELFKEKPCDNTGIIVVIPAYNEPDITLVLDSLALCDEPSCKAEVIIIVNLKKDTLPEAVLNNRKCIENIESWKKNNSNCFFRLFYFDTGIPSFKRWGVGLARKTGMDEATRRFNATDNPGGVIVCLDADCTVEKNYFVSIEKGLLNSKKHTACSLYYEHPFPRDNFSKGKYHYIVSYELHLRYYVCALRMVGYPYAFHTVGSAMAVKAKEYVRVGGMNRREAGEDFYFIQKLVQSDTYFSLNSTAVYPSARESMRVPFGTGATISMLSGKQGQHFLTYDFDAFRELGTVFGMRKYLFHCSVKESENIYKELPQGLRSFITEQEWMMRISEINANTSSFESFSKRYFGWFSMFRIVKFLNYVHDGIYLKKPVTLSAIEMLSYKGHEVVSDDEVYLLDYFRQMERGS